MKAPPCGVYEPAWMEIDLDALEFNLKAFKRLLAPGVRLMPVLKGDAYGTGAVMCAKTAIECGADSTAVIRVREAVILRQAGIHAPILNLGFCTDGETDFLLEHGITQTVHRNDFAAKLDSAARNAGKTIKVHLNVDTGMSRSGLPLEDLPDFLKRMKTLRNLSLEGVFTHFPTADCEDKSFAYEQIKQFKGVQKAVLEQGFKNVIFHTANTGAAIDIPESHFDMIRPGIGIYGLYASRHISRKAGLKPVSSLRAVISHVKTVHKDCGISYGHTYRTTHETPVATVQAGYVDGINRKLSNIGHAIVKGKLCRIVGRITMDQTIIEIENCPDAAVGDVATFIGSDGNECIMMDDVAESAGTIAHEIQCNINHRVPRVYLKGGQPIALQR